MSSVVLVVIAGVLLLSGTFGFTATTADRGISVAVANDSKAFIGYEAHEPEGVRAGQGVDIIEIKNRFAQNISVTHVRLSVSEEGINLTDPSTPERVEPGHSATIEAEVASCDRGASGTVTAEVTVKGEDVSATLADGDSEGVERSFTVTCAERDSQSGGELIKYSGNGGAQLKTDVSRNATVTFVDRDGNQRSQSGSFRPNMNLKNQLDEHASSQNTIVCVEIDSDQYPNPNLNNPCPDK
ncbi:hypothetical protein GRX03_03895 [Halovenus sp. WSH3]|uniref:Uncharacterized protein n=1 Tax=Halovenus carboxidivorans TaxID=2692199 RepID=A0A6B0SYB0_9EURY|nr:hypothetical protein [Halovenus carboxidivorans]MXR50748.1 hypothetical protein [Halovenus carboxidivorans]